MAFPPPDAVELGAFLKLVVVASRLEQEVLPTRAAWQREVMQPVRPAEEPFAVRLGQPVSHRLESLPRRAVQGAQLAREALGLFAEAEPQWEAPALVEENRREVAVQILALRERAWWARVGRLVSRLVQLERARR